MTTARRRTADRAGAEGSGQAPFLRRLPNDFGRSLFAGRAYAAGACTCCCCCCLDIIGAYGGAYVGGLVGAGIGHGAVRRHVPGLRSLGWVFLVSALSSVGLLVFSCAGAAIAISLAKYVPGDVWPAAAIVAGLLSVVWVFGVNPCAWFVVTGMFSGRVFGFAMAGSITGAVVGFLIGWAAMGESIVILILRDLG
jgi:hypothetical protein